MALGGPRIARGRVEVMWNENYQEWDIDSGHPNWIHTVASTRDEAIRKARRLKTPNQTIYVKGPQMSGFKKA